MVMWYSLSIEIHRFKKHEFSGLPQGIKLESSEFQMLFFTHVQLVLNFNFHKKLRDYNTSLYWTTT